MNENNVTDRKELRSGYSINRFIFVFTPITLLSIAWPVIVLLLVVGNVTATMSFAYAQAPSSTPAPTAEQLQECKTLGIDAKQCSEATILAKQRCLGPDCGVESTQQPALDPITLSIIVGSGIALIVGVLAVKRLRKVRKKATQEP